MKTKRTPTGLFIRDARRQLELSQAAFGELLGVRQNEMSNYETGRSTPPAPILMQIVHIFKEKGRGCPFCDRENPWQK